MTNAAVFQATFSDFRLVKGRKQAQIVFEVPLEDADAALKALGGVPRPDESRWFAIARLASGAQVEAPNSAAEGVEQIHKARKRWHELPASQRAALLGQEPVFWGWVKTKIAHLGETCADEHDAAKYIRQICGVKSRADIDKTPEALRYFNAMEASYMADTGRVASPER